MAELVVPQTPPLSRIPNVELMHTGTWALSTGVATFTTDDLYQAVAALACPAVRRPILKLGHNDPRFDGEPAVGYIDNLAVVENGYTLVGDYAGMPGWLGDVMASAYPDRSIEGEWGFVCQMGHTHPFVLTALALLGVMAPGIGSIESLQDVAALYGVTAVAAGSQQSGHGTQISIPIRATEDKRMPNPDSRKVAATVTSDDVCRAFYASPYGQGWEKWITGVQVDPVQVIYTDDDTGETYRLPVTIGSGDGVDAITFGDPIQVVLRYDDAAKVAASAGTDLIRFASREESRPGHRPAATEPPAEPAEGTTPNPTPEVIVADAPSTTLREALLTRLGVKDTEIDDDGLLAALTEALDERAADPPEPVVPAVPVLPEGVTVIDTAALQELQVAAAAGQQARRIQITEERDSTIRAAVRDGRIPVARVEHWTKQWDADPEGASKTLASLAAGTIPVVAAGVAGDSGEGMNPDEAAFKGLGLKQFAEASN